MAQNRVWGWRSLPFWLRYLILGLLILGITFRFVNLDGKIYWSDETLTSLRMSGYTRAELTKGLLTGEVISPDGVQQYQRPSSERGWSYTFKALRGTAEQAPLYYGLSRVWVEGIGHYSVAVMRSFPAVISLFGFPCLFWLCWELFQSTSVAWIALGLFAVTPLHVLYAQEARPYSLLTVCTLASSAALLAAMRSSTPRRWVLYAVTLIVGFYTQLLFGAIALAHGIYVITMEEVIQKRRVSSTLRAYLFAVAAALIAFSPWFVLLLDNLNRLRSTTASLAQAHPLPYVLARWVLNINRALMGDDVNSFNGVIVLLSLYALYAVCRQTPQRTWLFILTLVGVPFLVLALPDVMLGGERSTRIRYLIPSYIGLQLAIAYVFATQVVGARTWLQRSWRMLFIALVASLVTICTLIAQADIWWNKGVSRGAYYLTLPALVNRLDAPLLISDSRTSEILALSYRLDPHVRLQLVADPEALTIAQGFAPVLLINPSKKLRRVLTDQHYQVSLLYEDPYALPGDRGRLWRVAAPTQ